MWFSRTSHLAFYLRGVVRSEWIKKSWTFKLRPPILLIFALPSYFLVMGIITLLVLLEPVSITTAVFALSSYYPLNPGSTIHTSASTKLSFWSPFLIKTPVLFLSGTQYLTLKAAGAQEVSVCFWKKEAHTPCRKSFYLHVSSFKQDFTLSQTPAFYQRKLRENLHSDAHGFKLRELAAVWQRLGWTRNKTTMRSTISYAPAQERALPRWFVGWWSYPLSFRLLSLLTSVVSSTSFLPMQMGFSSHMKAPAASVTHFTPPKHRLPQFNLGILAGLWGISPQFELYHCRECFLPSQKHLSHGRKLLLQAQLLGGGAARWHFLVQLLLIHLPFKCIKLGEFLASSHCTFMLAFSGLLLVPSFTPENGVSQKLGY